MDIISVIGFTAGTITTVSFLPQVIKTLYTKSAHDVSIEMFSLLAFGIFLWIIYGLLLGSLPVILANSVSFVLVMTMVFLKV